MIAYTTEPWTLTAIQALAMNPSISYTIYSLPSGEFLVLSSEAFEKNKEYIRGMGGRFWMQTIGNDFLGLKVKDPLTQKTIPIIADEEIRNFYGSGINSVCPSYYIDDLKLSYVKKKLKKYF